MSKKSSKLFSKTVKNQVNKKQVPSDELFTREDTDTPNFSSKGKVLKLINYHSFIKQIKYSMNTLFN